LWPRSDFVEFRIVPRATNIFLRGPLNPLRRSRGGAKLRLNRFDQPSDRGRKESTSFARLGEFVLEGPVSELATNARVAARYLGFTHEGASAV
jgi:hypothetical protein